MVLNQSTIFGLGTRERQHPKTALRCDISAAITPPQALSHNFAHVLRQVRAATLEDAKGLGRSLVKALLLAIVVLSTPPFLSHSSAAKSRALASEIFRRRASRSSAVFNSVETRQLYNSVLMRYGHSVPRRN
jgi:hypothetical protein